MAERRATRRLRSASTRPSRCLGVPVRYDAASPATAARIALRSLARQHQQLSAEIADLDQLLKPMVAAINPRLVTANGVGTDVAGQLLITAGHNHDRLTSEAAFAMLCGAAPIPASSGRTNRHRLNRGGDRHANAALYRVVFCRLRWDPRTRAYAEQGEGVVRFVWRAMTPRGKGCGGEWGWRRGTGVCVMSLVITGPTPRFPLWTAVCRPPGRLRGRSHVSAIAAKNVNNTTHCRQILKPVSGLASNSRRRQVVGERAGEM